jgi:hypothetical protein
MRKLISVSLIIALFTCIFVGIPVSAATTGSTETSIEYLDNGDYIETVITDDTENDGISLYSTSTVTKTKTKYYKNSSGSVMWSVSVKGTFSYNGSAAVCTSCSHSTTSPGSAWSIKSASHSKVGNTATAKATATNTTTAGSTDYSMSVTLKCSSTGTVS